MSSKLCYRDLAHPSFQDSVKGHNHSTLKLVKTVAEFAQKVSIAHEQFANQVLNVVEAFKKRHQELRKERPVECPSTLNNAWEALLQETQYDAQAHADTATLLMKNVYTPLLEIASYKKSQAKKLYAFRESFENILHTSEENVYKCHQAYVEAYQEYRSNSNSRDSIKFMAAYHNAHNEYVLQIRAANHQEEEYHQVALPYLLEELEEIHIDLANTLNGAIESHALLLLTKANEQSRRFESILKMCKQVNPKYDVHNFVISVGQDPTIYEPKDYLFKPPSDPNIPGSELGTLKETVIMDRHTELTLKNKRQTLQKEASELTTYLKQNQDITQTLMSVCQRNLANHLYAKVYETQEDLCRKRNEIRLANLQLAAIRSQIEVLSPKQNGNASVDPDQASAKANKSTIKGMWKKAFKSLKSRDKDKDREKDKDRDRDRERDRDSREREKEREKDRDKDDRSSEKSEDSGRYSRQTSRQSSLKRVLMRKDSKEGASDSEQQPPSERKYGAPDPVFNTLKMAASIRKPLLSSGSQSMSLSSEEPEHFEPIREDEVFSSTPPGSAFSREPRQHRLHRGKQPQD